MTYPNANLQLLTTARVLRCERVCKFWADCILGYEPILRNKLFLYRQIPADGNGEHGDEDDNEDNSEDDNEDDNKGGEGVGEDEDEDNSNENKNSHFLSSGHWLRKGRLQVK